MKTEKRPTTRAGREAWKKAKAEQRERGKAAQTAKVKKARPAKKARIAKAVPKRLRKAREAKAEDGQPKAFRLVSGIPELPKEGTSGRKILESIKERGMATTDEIAKDIPKDVSPLTLRKYLRMFLDSKIVAVSEAAGQ